MLELDKNPGTIKDTTPQSIPVWLLRLFPLLGFLVGILVWLIDTWIDVYIIHPGEKFYESLFSDEATEIWMRSLVVLVMTASTYFAQHLLKRQTEVEFLLRKYQFHLEELVEERTHELEHMASLDPLTRIYNRRKFSEVLSYEIQRSKRYLHPLSLIMCDIDHFKAVNDQYGHEVGDDVLVKIAKRFKTCLRINDVYARWGGEEFIVLLSQSSLDEAKSVAEKLRQCIADIDMDSDFQVTCSFGVSQLHAEEESLPLIKRADEALYQAKAAGRNRVLVAE